MWPFKRRRGMITISDALKPPTREAFVVAWGEAIGIPRALVVATYKDVSEWSQRVSGADNQIAMIEARFARWADCASRGMEFPAPP